MEHEEIREKLSELRDGELSRADREAVTSHLEACASCRAAVQEWELLARAFLRPPERPSPQETALFVRRVMARLPAPPLALAPAFWETLATTRWLAPAFGVACAVLLLSFAPYARAGAGAERGAPLFVADGREVVLTPPDRASSSDLGEALDPAADER